MQILQIFVELCILVFFTVGAYMVPDWLGILKYTGEEDMSTVGRWLLGVMIQVISIFLLVLISILIDIARENFSKPSKS